MPELLREAKDLKLAALAASEAEEEASDTIRQIIKQHQGVMPPQQPKPPSVRL